MTKKTKLAVVHKAARVKRTSRTSRTVDLAQVRQRITNLIGDRALEMVRASADDAERKGNVAAMKFLFEMIGLFPAPVDDSAETKPGLAEALLSRLGTPDNEAEA